MAPYHGGPREPIPDLCRGAKVAAASAGPDGAGDRGTREHMSKTLQSGRAVDLKEYTSTRLRTVRRIAALSTAVLSMGNAPRLSASVVVY